MSDENKPQTALSCAAALIELEDSKGGVVSDSDLIPFFQNILDTARNEGRASQAAVNAQIINDMSRGTKSEERAIAIDEARDLILEAAQKLKEGV
jgi:hypothetical protein